MMPKKIVAVSQRVEIAESYNEWRDVLDQNLIDWVLQSGFLPVPIPNNLVDLNLSNKSQLNLDNWLCAFKIDAVLLSGGNNIGDIDNRDLTERYLLTWAEKHMKPVLGICRGMQMMGVYAGGNLIKVEGHVNTRHKLQIKKKYSELLPKTVNSYHNLVIEYCPPGFEILAESEDGNIEAMKHKELPWDGWMWHPEREHPFSDIDIKHLEVLFNN